jgi:hypothetical protein
MEKLMKKKQKQDGSATVASSSSITAADMNHDEDMFEEITRWFKTKKLDRKACPNPIAWWGVCVLPDIKRLRSHFFQFQFEYPILRLMACDYLSIPATSCIAERSFSMSARTDDPRRGRMQNLKFGGLQKLRAGYLDGRINVNSEIMRKYIGDFDFSDGDYSD